MKKSKKYKRWINSQRFIQKQSTLPIGERTMGNAKPNCYTCIYAGYIFNEEKSCLEPYCTNSSHLGRIYNLSITKWNDSFEKRVSNYENKVIYKNENVYRIA